MEQLYLRDMPSSLVQHTKEATLDIIRRATSTRVLEKAVKVAAAKVVRLNTQLAALDKQIAVARSKWIAAGQKLGTPEYKVWDSLRKQAEAITGSWKTGKPGTLQIAQKALEEAKYKLAIRLKADAMALVSDKLTNLGSQIAAKRAELEKLNTQLQVATSMEARGKHPPVSAKVLRDRVATAQAQLRKLEAQYVSAIKKMETDIKVDFRELSPAATGEGIRGYTLQPGLSGARVGGVLVADPTLTRPLSPSLIAAFQQAGVRPAVVGAGTALAVGSAAAARAVSDTITRVIVDTARRTVMAPEVGVTEEEWTTAAPAIERVVKAVPAEVISPAEAATMTPDVVAAIEEALRTGVEAAIRAAVEGKTSIEIEAATNLAVQQQVATLTEPAAQTQVQTKVKVITKTATAVVTRLKTKLRTLKVPKRIPPPLPDEAAARRDPEKIPDGSLAWAMGMFWKYIPAPWEKNKPHTMRHAPAGARNPQGTRPADTIQVIGKMPARVPKEVSIDLGVTDIFITDYGRKISFRGGGQKTNVGRRIDSTTKGMSVQEQGGVPLELGGEMFPPVPKTHPTKTKPKRKGLSHYEYVTTLKGFTP